MKRIIKIIQQRRDYLVAGLSPPRRSPSSGYRLSWITISCNRRLRPFSPTFPQNPDRRWFRAAWSRRARPGFVSTSTRSRLFIGAFTANRRRLTIGSKMVDKVSETVRRNGCTVGVYEQQSKMEVKQATKGVKGEGKEDFTMMHRRLTVAPPALVLLSRQRPSTHIYAYVVTISALKFPPIHELLHSSSFRRRFPFHAYVCKVATRHARLLSQKCAKRALHLRWVLLKNIFQLVTENGKTRSTRFTKPLDWTLHDKKMTKLFGEIIWENEIYPVLLHRGGYLLYKRV